MFVEKLRDPHSIPAQRSVGLVLDDASFEEVLLFLQVHALGPREGCPGILLGVDFHSALNSEVEGLVTPTGGADSPATLSAVIEDAIPQKGAIAHQAFRPILAASLKPVRPPYGRPSSPSEHGYLPTAPH
ncbi:hypothetical protein FQZ97_1077150 [compost metagenome]